MNAGSTVAPEAIATRSGPRGKYASRPKKGTATPVLSKSRSPCIATIPFSDSARSTDERRHEAAVDPDLGDAASARGGAGAALDAREDVRHEHDVDRLLHLRQHQAAHLPVAEVRRQQQDALARPGGPRRCASSRRRSRRDGRPRPAGASRTAGSRPRRAKCESTMAHAARAHLGGGLRLAQDDREIGAHGPQVLRDARGSRCAASGLPAVAASGPAARSRAVRASRETRRATRPRRARARRDCASPFFPARGVS